MKANLWLDFGQKIKNLNQKFKNLNQKFKNLKVNSEWDGNKVFSIRSLNSYEPKDFHELREKSGILLLFHYFVGLLSIRYWSQFLATSLKFLTFNRCLISYKHIPTRMSWLQLWIGRPHKWLFRMECKLIPTLAIKSEETAEFNLTFVYL